MKLPATTIRYLAILALAACGLATIFSFLGRLNWALDLFSHFHLQYAVALICLVICFAALKQRILLAVSAILLLPHLACLSYYLPRDHPPSTPGDNAFTVQSFNVLTHNSRHDEVLAHLRDSGADLIVLLEVDEHWITSLRPLETTHPHVRQIPRPDNFGMALYSRLPIQRHEVVALPRNLPCMITRIDWNGTPLTVISAHPLPPVGGNATQIRDQYLEQLGPLATKAAADSEVLLLGDLNTTPWSHCFRNLIDSSGLADSGRHRGFRSSWHRLNPVFSLPLDHILHSPGLRPVDRWVGPDLGSDHRPVGGSFRLVGPGRQ